LGGRTADLEAVLDAALDTPGADEVEVRVTRSWGGLARFARSSIHQHVATEDATVAVRVAVGTQVGTASSNDATAAGAAAVAGRALAAARVAPPDPAYPGLAGPAPLPAVPRRFDPETAAASPARRAEAVARLLGALGTTQEAAGAVSSSATEAALATSAGARHLGRATRAGLSAVVSTRAASGHTEDAAVSLDALDPAAAGAEAADTCARASDPGDVEPGTWTVVLGPSAVMTLLEHLALTAFAGKAFNEGRSAFSGRLGETVASSLVSVADDALADGAIGLPFDDEGTPRQRVELVTDGVATGVVHDRASAAAAGLTSTGHGLAAPNPWGPLALHLVLAPGRSSVGELVGGVERGLWVTRFWYTRTVNPKQTVITGMTRDGTFLIEDGRLGAPVRNLRFNQSILEALASCDGVGDRLRTCVDELGDSRAPAVRLRSFVFTSVSDH
jgi:PmbA protein